MAKPWNPMADAYGNREFNTYQQGPGANLDDSHQPGALANAASMKTPFRLCLKGVPKDMTPQGVRNLCSAFGKVVDIHTSPRTPYIFVSFATFNDMERVQNGLKDNPHGIIADFAKENKKSSQAGSESGKDENKNPASSSANTPLQSQIDMNRRSIKGPFTNPPRPQTFRKQPLHDMHDGDRNKPKPDHSAGGKQMHTGRPYYTEPRETTEHIRKLAESSKGSYNPQKNEYVNQSNVTINGNILGNCIRCSKPANKVCQRCEDFYCSFECQKKDWQKHRYICFQMPKLVPPNSNNIGVKLPETTPNLTTASKSQPENVSQNCQNQPQVKGDPRRQVNQKSQANAVNANAPQNNQPQTPANGPQKKPEDPAPKAPEPKPKPTIKNTDPPASGSTVAITTISKSNLVYIRSLAPNDNIEYIKILNIVNTQAKKCPVIEKLPERGDILVSDFQDTGYYRVLVVNVTNKDKIAVAYIDFGNVEEKKLSELRALPDEAYDCARYAIPVILKDVKDFQANEEILAYLNSFADASGKELKISYDNIAEGVELIDLATNENINRKVLEMQKVEVPQDDDTPVMNSDIEMRLLPDGENVPVYVFDNSFLQTGCISCIHESDVLKLEGFNKQIQEYAEKTTETYTPREQELCLVKYEEDGVWYRAECIEVVGDGHPSVLFIDYGNVTLAKIENIRKFPKEFAYPCFTSSCLIQGLPEELDDKAVQKLTELIPINEKLVLEKVVSVVESEINQVEISKVVDILKAESLI